MSNLRHTSQQIQQQQLRISTNQHDHHRHRPFMMKKSKQIFVYILQNCITTAPPPAVLAEVEAKIIQLQFNNYLLLLSHLLNIMV